MSPHTRTAAHLAGLREESDWHYLQFSDAWPDLELFRKLPFDYIIHDPKYEDASLICTHTASVPNEGQACLSTPPFPTSLGAAWVGVGSVLSAMKAGGGGYLSHA